MEIIESRQLYLGNLEPQVVRLPETGQAHNKIVTVTGVTSSGKDYLLDRCETGDSVSILNYGTLLSNKLSVDRDEVRHISPDALIKAQRECTDEILSYSPSLLNSHVVVKHNGLYMFNYEVEKKLNPEYYIVVLTNPEQVHQWRENRNTSGMRSSDSESIEEIYFHQEMLLRVLNLITSLNGNGLITLNNTESQINNNIHALYNVIDQIQTNP